LIYFVGGLFRDLVSCVSICVAEIKHLLSLTENNLRTINDLCNWIIDAGHSRVYNRLLFPGSSHPIFYDVRSPGHSIIYASHSVIYTGHSIIDACDSIIHTGHSNIDASNSIVHVGHPIVDGHHCICDSPHSLINIMRRLQDFCNRHSSFLLCQLVQLLQRIFHIRPSD
jgi:hypothetical protein